MAKQQPLPRIHRVEFFRSREEELAVALAMAIAQHAEQFPQAKLSDHHAAISAWSAAVIEVPNGGFMQFFYNRRGDQGVAELADLLDSLGLSNAATDLRDAADLYQQHREKFDVSDPFGGLFGSIEEFDEIDQSFMTATTRCNRALDTWARKHIHELMTDEAGEPIDPKFTGKLESFYPTGQVRESLEVNKGKPHGAYYEYFEDGSVRQGVFYKSGKVSGDFWPSGQLKRNETKQGKTTIIEWFYPSGTLQKRYVKNKDGYAVEPIRLYHENGQLAEELTMAEGDKRGPWLKFFEDGSPELQAEYRADQELVVHNAWNAEREQVVKDGTGTFREYPAGIDWEYSIYFANGWPREYELQGGVPHGKVTTYRDGVVWSIEQYTHGQPDGESTTYWDNGRVRSMTKYVQGEPGKEKEFPKFDDPVPAVLLRVDANAELYSAWGHIAVDEYPQPLNLAEIQSELKIPQFLQEVHERNVAGTVEDDYEDCNTFDDGIAYSLTVDESGKVTAATANGSGMYSGGEWDTYPPLLRKLRFAPGKRGGQPLECTVLARVDHTFIEREGQE